MIAYIGVGSNLGDKHRNCCEAVERLDRVPGCRVIKTSPWYRTRPVGVKDQDWYVNGVIALEVGISARRLLTDLLGIESAMGRIRTEKWGPRIVDLDILLVGQEILHDPDLQVPHPLMHTRSFVLAPMVDLAPRLVHPVLQRTMTELLDDLKEEEQDVILLEG